MKVDGGRYYAVGDRLVALVPNPQAGIVTSEPLTVLATEEDALTVRTSEGRAVALTGEALDTKHLDYGYALTVHRAQGATYDRAHILTAGGGRELGYVALSRARDHTTIHAFADDLDQAVDDIQADWGVARHQRWITDTLARHGRQPEPARAAKPAPNVRELPARSLADRQREARGRLVDLQDDFDALHTGTGRWRYTADSDCEAFRSEEGDAGDPRPSRPAPSARSLVRCRPR